MDFKKELSLWVLEAFEKAMGRRPAPEDLASSFEVPREERFGDLAVNLALREAKTEKKAPRALAEAVVARLRETLPKTPIFDRIREAKVEGPGFINLYFSEKHLTGVLGEIRDQGNAFGRPHVSAKKILLEYVSANPTGPLTVAHGRQAALGDSLARVLRFCGHSIDTEYYNNDEGVQINTLGLSTQCRLKEILTGHKAELPENYYQGDYLIETAKRLLAEHPEAKTMADQAQLELCRDFAKNDILKGIRKDLADFDVDFVHFYSQKELGHSGKVERTLEELKGTGSVFEEDGAVWFRSTAFGDDKDRVLVKSDKNYTYLTPDIAYHHEKFKRGYDELINIWGPDHHGYIARLKATQQALGHDPKKIQILIAQLVTLYEGDRQVRMSTRAGEFVTLRQILDEVGRDAGRFFFLMRKFDAHLDFDLSLAKSQTPENPVFYIQYAHARIESIKNLFVEKTGRSYQEGAFNAESLSLLREPAEFKILRFLSLFEETVEAAARTLEPYRLVPYLMDVASAFHRFYTDHRVVSEDRILTEARMALIVGAQHVLKTGLTLLGVSAPAKM